MTPAIYAARDADALCAPCGVDAVVECVLHTDLYHRVGYLYNVYLLCGYLYGGCLVSGFLACYHSAIEGVDGDGFALSCSADADDALVALHLDAACRGGCDGAALLHVGYVEHGIAMDSRCDECGAIRSITVNISAYD